jgi:hypothetical protein
VQARSNPTHDNYIEYVIECGTLAQNLDFHEHRWIEYRKPVGPVEDLNDPNVDGNDDDPERTDDLNSLGDLNNGFGSEELVP